MRPRPILFVVLAACNTTVPESADPVCEVLLESPAPVEAACEGELTAVVVADAGRCDPADTTDDRRELYPVGATPVRFDASLGRVGFRHTAACSTTVTVVDDVPPDVACEAAITVAYGGPDAPLPTVPQGTATDTCDADLEITVSPEILTEDTTEVVTTATDDSGNTGDCTTRVDMLTVLPVDGYRLLGAELDDVGDTVVTFGWEPATDDTDTLELQRSVDGFGDWTTVETAPVDALVVSTTQAEAGWYRLRSASQGLAGGHTERLQVHAVATDAYIVEGVTVPTVPFATSLYGVVRYPTDMGDEPLPLVLLMHGNHGNCRRNGTQQDYCATLTDHTCPYGGYSAAPNAEGMAYLAEMLAARGFIAATVSANALNCRGGYILERAQLLRTHLQAWSDWDDGASGPMGTRFAGRVDLSRVGLVGHSRGGDAVSHVPQALADAPIDGVDVVSIHAIAPTDYNDATVFDASWSLLLPACDGDVSSLWGSDIYERSTDTVWHKNQVFFPGANHNFFNTEWVYDDARTACSASDRVGSRPQVTMLQATLGSWMSRTLDDDLPTALQRAEADTPVDLRWSYTTDGALLIDAFEGELLVNELNGSTEFGAFETVAPCFGSECGGAFLHETSAVRLAWRDTPATASFGVGAADTGQYDALSFRVASTTSS